MGGDILIGGWTVHDDNSSALRSILASAWVDRFAAGDNYDDIDDDLVNDWLTPADEVFDDGAKDKLTGDNKSRDVFFADQDGDDGDDDKVKGGRLRGHSCGDTADTADTAV